VVNLSIKQIVSGLYTPFFGDEDSTDLITFFMRKQGNKLLSKPTGNILPVNNKQLSSSCNFESLTLI